MFSGRRLRFAVLATAIALGAGLWAILPASSSTPPSKATLQASSATPRAQASTSASSSAQRPPLPSAHKSPARGTAAASAMWASGGGRRSPASDPVAPLTALAPAAPPSGAAGIARARSLQSGVSLTPSATEPHWACPQSLCESIVDPPAQRTAAGWRLPGATQTLEGSGEKGGYDPSDLQQAYDVSTSGGEPQQRYEEAQTIALVDAGYIATAESNLAEYRKTYGLPACTHSTGCFRQVNEHGEEGHPPPVNEEWALETSLDLDMATAMCPHCHLLLVESTNESLTDLAESANTAAHLGATVISNSYGLPEEETTAGEFGSFGCGSTYCRQLDTDYNHPGVIETVSAGDGGYDNYLRGGIAPLFPAVASTVIAVGGTTLHKLATGSGRHWSESVWWESKYDLGTGSGCSSVRAKPPWQKDTGCSHRTDNDVAVVGACETPVSVYTVDGWEDVCGTSVGSPLVAGIEAHAGESADSVPTADAFYEERSSLYAVTKGKNDKSCSPEYLCSAEAAQSGYSGPVGNGTPASGTVAVAAEAPSVRTGLASEAKAGELALGGTIDSNGTSTTYRFEYGPTTSYGSSFPAGEASAGSGTTASTVSQTIPLQQSGTYHYRIAATNSDGTVYGEDATVAYGPTVTKLSIGSGSTGGLTPVTISGTHFKEVSAVRFGSAEAPKFTVTSEGSIAALSPPGSGTQEVTVTTASGTSPTSAADQFTYKSVLPSISLLEPGHGSASGGSRVTITGSGLSGATAVRFGSVAALGYEVLSETTIVAVAPSQAGTVSVAVETPTGTSTGVAADEFTYEPAYYLSALWPLEPSLAATPGGIAVNSQGDVWVSQWWGNQVEELSPSGSLIRTATIEAPCTASLVHPWGLAIDAEGNLWVADAGENRILELSSEGKCKAQLGTAGNGKGELDYPTDIAIGHAGRLWVADMANQRVQELSATGEYIRQLGTGAFGSAPGEVLLPQGVAVGTNGDIWVSEPFNGRVQEWSEGGAYLGAIPALFPEGQALAAGSEGNVWIADGSDTVREYTANRQELLQFGSAGRGQGQLEGPDGLTVDASGNVWLSNQLPDAIERWSPPG